MPSYDSIANGFIVQNPCNIRQSVAPEEELPETNIDIEVISSVAVYQDKLRAPMPHPSLSASHSQ